MIKKQSVAFFSETPCTCTSNSVYFVLFLCDNYSQSLPVLNITGVCNSGLFPICVVRRVSPSNPCCFVLLHDKGGIVSVKRSCCRLCGNGPTYFVKSDTSTVIHSRCTILDYIMLLQSLSLVLTSHLIPN